MKVNELIAKLIELRDQHNLGENQVGFKYKYLQEIYIPKLVYIEETYIVKAYLQITCE